MKGLSFSQPWLWAILHANKRVENRDWMPPIDMIGQQIALHAAKSFDDDGVPFLGTLGIEDRPTSYVKSAIVGVATIDRVVTKDKTLPDDQRRWFFGPNGWILRDVVEIAQPIPWDGALSLWLVPPIVESLIHRQLDGEHVSAYLPAFTAALATVGVESATEWAATHPGEHLWFEYGSPPLGPVPSCVACGKVKPRDTSKRPGKPCRGVVGISLRGADA